MISKERVHELRAMGLTQKQVADRLGCSLSWIKQISRKEPREKSKSV